MTAVLALAGALLLVAANAVFVGAEFSLTSIDRTRLERRAEEGDRRVQGVLAAVRTLSFQLSGTQLGITVCSLVIGYLAEPAIGELLARPLGLTGLPTGVAAGLATALGLLISTMVLTIFGELVPKNAAVARPLATALIVVPAQRAFTAACRPLIALLNNTANMVVRRLGIEPRDELSTGRSRAELSAAVSASVESGALEPATAELLRRSLVFDDRTIADVLTPRTRLASLPGGATLADLAELSRRTGFSRFPVHGDRVDELIGAVHVKAVFTVPAAERANTPVDGVVTPLPLLPETLGCDDALRQLREARLQMAAAVDEYGGIAGVATLEDLVEELVGEVVDEHDQPEEPDIVERGDGEWSVTGLLRDDAAAERLGFNPPPGRYETLAGLVLLHAGRLPDPGDEVVVDDELDGRPWRLTVEERDGARVARILLAREGER